MKSLYIPLTVAFALAATLFGYQAAYGLTVKGDTESISLKTTQKMSRKIGLVSTRIESQTKKELLKLKKKSPQDFDTRLADNLNNSAEFQGWLFEVRDGLGTIEKAKSIAKHELYKAIEKNWKNVQTTTVNKSATSDWKTFRKSLVDQINAISYKPYGENGYLFKIEDWATVKVSKDLRSTSWFLNIHSTYDGNKLQAGVDKIQIPETPKKKRKSRL